MIKESAKFAVMETTLQKVIDITIINRIKAILVTKVKKMQITQFKIPITINVSQKEIIKNPISLRRKITRLKKGQT